MTDGPPLGPILQARHSHAQDGISVSGHVIRPVLHDLAPFLQQIVAHVGFLELVRHMRQGVFHGVEEIPAMTPRPRLEACPEAVTGQGGVEPLHELQDGILADRAIDGGRLCKDKVLLACQGAC